MNLRRLTLAGGIATVLLLHLQPFMSNRGRHHPPGFDVPPPASSAALDPVPRFVRAPIDSSGSIPSVHVASLCEPNPGILAAAWYGGTREGARDVAIFFSTQKNRERWSEAQVLVTAESAQNELGHYVRKVGNPVVFSNTQGRIRLLYVAIAVGGWSGSSLCLKESDDSGTTWSPSRRLVLSPFFNVSELVKNGPTPLAGGGWVVPIYHELFGKFPELLWMDESGHPSSPIRTRAFGGRTAFQPAMVALDSEQAVLLCRTANDRRDLLISRTADRGETWSPPTPSGLPNSDSGIDAIRLASGRLLLAFNDTNSGRANLRLATSNDAGRTWSRGPVVESEDGEEFSYPFLLQTRDGWIHMAYTWKRRAIQVATFNESWTAPARDPANP